MNLHKVKHRLFFYLFFISLCFALSMFFSVPVDRTTFNCLYVAASMGNCEAGFFLGRSAKLSMRKSMHAKHIISIMDAMDRDDRLDDSDKWRIIRMSFEGFRNDNRTRR